ncbi:MAG: beta-galactosidase, partial [Planctomycetia bacterium]|nr:beta-galactosidase [Planctomycetia bacterium]
FYGSSLYDYPHSGSTEPRGRHCLHGRQRGAGEYFPKVTLGQKPREYSIIFTTNRKADHTGMVRFLTDNVPGDIVLDNIRVEEVETGQAVFPVSDFEDSVPIEKFWRCFPKGKEPKVTAAIKPGCGKDHSTGLILSFPVGFEKATYTLQLCSLKNLIFETNTKYKVSFWARASTKRTLIVSFVHRTETETITIGSTDDQEGVFEEQIRLAAAAGANFVTFPLGLPWPKPGEAPFWQGIDITCQRILKINPNAILIPRIRLDPPVWWLAQHPDEEFRPCVASDDSIRVAAVGSKLWRKEAEIRLRELVKYMEKKFGKHVAGYHLCAQNSCEWFYPHTSKKGNISDNSPANIAAWQQWLQRRYGTIEKLRNAWKSDVSSFETAALPDYAYRMHLLDSKPFLDPVQNGNERMVIDYQRYQQEVMTEAIVLFAKSVKNETAGKKLVVIFYGYNFSGGGLNGPSAMGHRDMRTLLDCPYVDILCAPVTYGYCRALGGGAYPVAATESISLAGKMWWNEDDTRTHLSRLPKGALGETGKAESQEDSLNLLTRNLGQEYLRNLGTWWMDLGMSGWFNDPALWARMKQMQPMGEYFAQNAVPWKGEIALLTDDQSAAYVPNPLVAANLVWRLLAWCRNGVPFGQYMFDDFLAGKVDA